MTTRPASLKNQLEVLVADMVRRGIRLDEARAEFEREFLEQTLRTCGGNQTRAAEVLQVHRNTLRRKLEELGVGKEI